MSDEIPAEIPPAAPFELPPPVSRVVTLTWTRPYIVIGQDDGSITVHKEVLSQQDYQVEENYSFEPVKETPFKIVSLSPIQFGQGRLNVLDENSMPRGRDYLALVGQRVMVGFRCVKHEMLSGAAGRDVFFVYRSFLTLP